MEDSVRWSLKVSRDTDEALRAYLGRTGGRKGDLSRFVQEAVQVQLRQKARAPGTPPGGRWRRGGGHHQLHCQHRLDVAA